MMNHAEIIWRYADALSRQAEINGKPTNTRPILSALAAPSTARRQLRIRGFR